MDSIFCTVLSKSRVYQFIAFYFSLENNMKEFRLFVLCIDDETHFLLKKMKLRHLILTHVSELENEYLLKIKKERKLNEYCWTLKPIYIESLMSSFGRVTYTDSDLFCWSDPTVIFHNQPHCSVLLSRHTLYLPTLPLKEIKFRQELFGNYNSGFISFRKDEVGIASIQFWKQRCLEYCHEKGISGSFGDQTYLNYLPSLFPRVCDITTPGVNHGLWDFRLYKFHIKNNQVYVDDAKLIIYHFSGCRIVSEDNIVLVHHIPDNRAIISFESKEIGLPIIYPTYKHILIRVIELVKNVDPGFIGYENMAATDTGGKTLSGDIAITKQKKQPTKKD